MLDVKMTDIMNKGLKEAQRQQQAYKKLNKVNVGTKGHIDHGTNPLQEAFEQWCDENYYYKSTQIDRKYSHELQLVWEAATNQAIEKCAAICDNYGHGWKVLGDEIRTLKGNKDV